MNKQIYIVSSIVGFIASLICLFFDWKISTGILIGLISSLVYFYLLIKSYKINEDGSLHKGSGLALIFRILVLALPLLIACLLPDYFNVFGAFGGVMVFRLITYVYFFKQKGDI